MKNPLQVGFRQSLLLISMFVCWGLNAQSLDGEKIRDKCMGGAVSIRLPDGGFGSGFLVNAEGYILTNYHVIESSIYFPVQIEIKFADGSLYSVRKIIGYKDTNEEDIALLKIDLPEGYTVLPILPKSDVKQAAEVAAIGSPLGLEFSFNKGSVSNTLPQAEEPHLFQMDIAVNPGNSGGAVLNRNGQVVGMVVSGIRSNRVSGINFAIKASTIREFLDLHEVTYQTAPLISETELKKSRELSEEEKNALRNQELTRIEAEKQAALEAQKYKLEQLKIEAENQKKLQEQKFQQDQERLAQEKEWEKIRLEKEKMRLQDEKIAREKARKAEKAGLPKHLSLKLGGGTQYYEANVIDNPQQSLTSEGLYPLLNGMLAYRFGIKKTEKKERGSSLGVFSHAGFLNAPATQNLLQNNSLSLPTGTLKNYQSFWEVEAGGLIREWFRLSAGLGRQDIKTEINTQTLNYYTSTMGFVMRFGLLELDLTMTGLYGGFYQEPALRANLTLNLHFKLFRW